MSKFIDVVLPLILDESVRTSTKAVAISCISHIARRYCDIFLKSFEQHNKNIMEFSKQFVEHSDPLIRGSINALMGYLVAGYLYQSKQSANPFKSSTPIQEMLEILLKGLHDSSSITVKMACKSLGKSLKALTSLQLCRLFPENGIWSLKILQALLSTIKEDAYWLVQVEVKKKKKLLFFLSLFFFDFFLKKALAALAKCDYRVVYCLERGTKEGISDTGYTSFGGIEIIQKRILEFILWYKLGDQDARVRNQAASALVAFVPKLCFNLQIEQVNTGISVSDIRGSVHKVNKKSI